MIPLDLIANRFLFGIDNYYYRVIADDVPSMSYFNIAFLIIEIWDS